MNVKKLLLDLSEKTDLVLRNYRYELIILARFEFLSVKMMKIQVFWVTPLC